MSLPTCNEVKRLFAIATDYDGTNDWPRFATPKLNGVRGMWVPDVGFVSKDGIPWNDGIFPHIEPLLKSCIMLIDGEFYLHGMSLQDINSRCAIMRNQPHLEVRHLQFHAFDAPFALGGFEDRMLYLRKHRTWGDDSPIKIVPHRAVTCCRTADSAHEAYVSMGYEGTVYKSGSHYRFGKSGMMLKRKAWQDAEFDVVKLVEGTGDGKYEATLGAVICRTKEGKEFRVGAFEFNDEARFAVWIGAKPAQAKVRYLGLTNEGIPYNSRVLAFL